VKTMYPVKEQRHPGNDDVSLMKRPHHHPWKRGVSQSIYYIQGSANNSITEMKYMCSSAPASYISQFPEPFRTAIQNSRQWKWERSQNVETTECWPSLFPEDNTQDVSLTIWCGNNDGYRLTKFFGSQVTRSS